MIAEGAGSYPTRPNALPTVGSGPKSAHTPEANVITANSWEEEYGGKVTCFLDVIDRGEVIQWRSGPAAELVPLAAELEGHGVRCVVRRFGETIYGANQ